MISRPVLPLGRARLRRECIPNMPPKSASHSAATKQPESSQQK